MRLRLTLHLAVALGLTALLIDLVVLLWTYREVARNEAGHAFGLAASLASLSTSVPAAQLDTVLARVAERSGQVLLRLDPQGHVLWTSDLELARRASEIKQLPRHNDASPPPIGERQALYVTALERPGSSLGSVAVLVDASGIWRQVLRSHRAVLGYLLADLLVVLLFSWALVGRLVLRPLARLNAAVAELSFDDPLFTASALASAGTDEFGRLGRSVAAMTRQLEGDKRAIATQLEALKQAQQDLIQQERLAVAGRLAAGLAHDIGNPLGIVQGYLALFDGAAPEQLPSLVAKCERELGRIHQTINELLAISRPITLARAPASLAPLLADLVERMRVSPRLAQIDLTLTPVPPELRAEVDRERLNRALENLLVNAADACAGTLAKRGQVQLSAMARGERVVIQVCDNGPGVAPEQRTEVLKPFVSSKPPGKGTGLGLYVARQIAVLHGGELTLEDSQLGGLCVAVALPRL